MAYRRQLSAKLGHGPQPATHGAVGWVQGGGSQAGLRWVVVACGCRRGLAGRGLLALLSIGGIAVAGVVANNNTTNISTNTHRPPPLLMCWGWSWW